MNNSSRSAGRRGKSGRRVRVRTVLARRLGIEAMESRVLLSGTTLDPSIFGTDLTPASYATQFIAPFADSRNLAVGSANVTLSVGTPVFGNEGGFTDAVLNNTLGTNAGTVPADHTAGDSNDIGFGRGIIVIGSGEANPGVVTDATGGSLQSASGGTRELPFFANSDEGGLSGTISPRVITAAWNNEGSWTVSPATTASEGGSISVASIRTEFLQPTVAEKADFGVASTAGEREASDSVSPSVADARPWASNEIDGEWTRAVAMESANGVQSRVRVDRRDSSSDAAAHDQATVSAGDVRSLGDERSVNKSSASERTEASTGPMIDMPLSVDRPAIGSASQSAVLTSMVNKTYGGSALVTAHRLEATGRNESTDRGDDSSVPHLVRDEVFSEWHPISIVEGQLVPQGTGDQRLWVSPGPFLAVLALERFVRIDPKEKQAAQLGQSQRGLPTR
jgi:hypothetical protein